MPLETLRVGSIGCENILKLALKNNSVVLIASTSEVYGDPKVHPQSEKYWGNVNPIGPRSVYDEAKRFQEAITMAYHRKYNLKIRIVRIFNTYGPRMRVDDGRALPNFISQAFNNEKITVYGDGNQTRSFCYVDDLIDGIYKLLHSSYCMPVNLGNPDEISLLDFAKEIIRIVGNKNELLFMPLPKDDPMRRKPDITKAKNILNWEPKVNRKLGLQKTIKYFSSIFN